MKRVLLFPFLFFACMVLPACNPSDDTPSVPEENLSGQSEDSSGESENSEENENLGNPDNDDALMENNTLTLTVNDRSFTATLADNSATEALKERLVQGALEVRLDDYGNMEKVGSLGFSLPRTDRQTTTVPGDIMLYQGSSIVIFYGSNSWAYTPLAKVDGVSTREEMLDLLGGMGNITLTLSLAE
ncbi:MAG TPA: cyclophilin-like fold protein [Bacteroides mediterraneensis]|uniref:cyclophilin-like fold protein n=1 Tax=Bacteroides mediterraneensis TaxID=1841856 RepID=UPI00262A797C|nr:cyclophilin-like fold protein [Bacteroides mediterraneensis]HJH64423.1 cyclophilin-like fold protein [Bacteroides mediterraneensis]